MSNAVRLSRPRPFDYNRDPRAGDDSLGFIDLHSHILPGLDDGARDIETSLRIIEGLCALGFRTVCATPHQKDGQFMPSAEAIGAAYQTTRSHTESAGLEVTLVRAAENMWDTIFYERVLTDAVPCYGESRAFLVEVRVHELPVGMLEQIFRMRTRGWLPVIAHPERYQPLWKSPETMRRLAEHCAMVVDLGAVAGHHGRKQAKVARSLLQEGLAHAAASDAHAPEDVRSAEEGLAWIRKKLGAKALPRLLEEAPAKILAGCHPAA